MVHRKRTTRPVQVDALVIGGDAPVSIQGMTKTKTADIRNTQKQILSLKETGAEIVRLAIRDEDDLAAFQSLKKRAGLPLVADIHFRSDLALAAIKVGADKIRLNPGNIKDPEQLKKIIREAKKNGIAIRIGVNSGSLKFHPHLTSPLKGEDSCNVGEENSAAIARSMVSAAGNYLKIFESENFSNLVISLKSSSVQTTVLANRLFSQRYDYPLHLGVTEAGRGPLSLIKSAIGIGSLLEEGIGDTIRVSLSEPPEKEIEAGRQILQALGLRHFYPEIISCPTCGRCRVNLFKILEKVETGIKKLPGYPDGYAGLKIAVMGCEVNGPGEAAAADIGIAAGRKAGLLFAKGKAAVKISEEKLAAVLLKEIAKLRKTW